MTISVHKAVLLPKDSPWFSHALPENFPFLVIDEQSKIIEPALLYLIHTQLKRGPRHWKQHTADAMAYDLRDWFDYLAHCQWVNPVTKKLEVGKPWDVAAESDYIAWRDTMQEVISPQTNKHLSSRTIARRQVYVERFYAYAQKKGWYDGEFVISKIRKGRLSHDINQGEFDPESNSAKAEVVVSEYRERMEYGEPVRPLSEDEWHRIQLELGPLPSEREFDLRPSRDRIASELTIGTGMRVDEVTSLTEFQLRDLHQAWLVADEEQRKDGFFALYIVKTKRLKPRTVLVPGYLIPELMVYLDNEREASIIRGMTRANAKGQKYNRPTSLFVNHTESAVHSGNAVRATSLSCEFKKACLDAKITHSVEKIDIETSERYRVNLSKHHFHDLRHTFAVWTYHNLKSNGETEPWKEIQVRLGHANLKVTMDTYLKVVDVDRRNAGRVQYNFKRTMGQPDA
ncbi:tyrosine-type recombinase/integrase [Janthinobacterium sp. LB3P118]|uniref:tyrosine-type recombinase/integrase n=1 Tax=Janthinobacterium sp. LB3P118 TaxID=3424195 RepID=UPI003F28DBA5